MNENQSEIKDPVCGMAVGITKALYAERNGLMFGFCSDHCRKKFLSVPVGVNRDYTYRERVLEAVDDQGSDLRNNGE